MKKRFISLVTALATTAVLSMGQLVAFPGAEGFGKYAAGARGQSSTSVYHVTNLNNSGAGSFRDAVSKPGRIVVFDVSGVIKVTKGQPITFAKNLYIAGQTAPGKGVEVYGERISFSGANNLICRHMRFRMGIGGTSGKDAVSLANGTNMIFDHCSVSWGRDETFSINWDGKGSEPGDITIQNCIMSQGLLTHSCGGLMQTNGGVTLIRNLYADNHTRNNKFKGVHQFINNLVYNWGGGGAAILGDSEGASWVHIIGNNFIAGPNSTIKAFSRATPQFQLYHADNYIDDNRNGRRDGWVAGNGDFKRSNTENVYPTFISSPTGWATAIPKALPVINTILSNGAAYEYVINNAGATLPFRDEVDEYVINEVKSIGTRGKTITKESENGITNNVGFFAPVNKQRDTDNDGIPDSWEQSHGLNYRDASDALAVAASGYLNIEEYINSITRGVDFCYAQTDLKVTGVTATSGSLSWVNNDPVAYKSITVRIFNENEELPAVTLNGTATSVNLVNLQPSTQYHAFIYAIGANGVSTGYSSTVYFTTDKAPNVPITINAALKHTASAYYGARTETNTIDAATELFNNDALSAWSSFSFADFMLNIPATATIQSATLKFSGLQYGRYGRQSVVYALNEGQQLNYQVDATAADWSTSIMNRDAVPNHQYADSRFFVANFSTPAGNSAAYTATIDVTEAVAALLSQGNVVFQITGNAGSATLNGKASSSAPTLTITYIENDNKSLELDADAVVMDGEAIAMPARGNDVQLKNGNVMHDLFGRRLKSAPKNGMYIENRRIRISH